MNYQKGERNLLGFPFKNSNLTRILNASGNLQAVAQRADGRKILVSLLMASFVVFINVSGILRLPELLLYDALVFHYYDNLKRHLQTGQLESNTDQHRATVFMINLAEALLDPGQAIKRRKAANQIYQDLADERISHARAAIELQTLNKKQKGGWLRKAFRKSKQTV